MAQETLLIETWLYSLLSGDAALAALIGARVYSYQAPQNAPLPYVLFTSMGGNDINALGARGGTQPRYLVKVVGAGNDFAAIQSIVDRVDTLLQDARQDTDGNRIRCQRVQTFQQIETEGDQNFSHVGGVYRITHSA